MNLDLKDVLIAAIPSIIPTVMVGFGILANKSDINRVSGEIVNFRTELRGEITALRAEMRSDISRLDKTLNDAVLMLINIGNELDKRVSRLEDKN